MYLFVGKRPVAHINAHPPVFTIELQAPMGAKIPVTEPQSFFISRCTVVCLHVHKLYQGEKLSNCVVLLNLQVWQPIKTVLRVWLCRSTMWKSLLHLVQASRKVGQLSYVCVCVCVCMCVCTYVRTYVRTNSSFSVKFMFQEPTWCWHQTTIYGSTVLHLSCLQWSFYQPGALCSPGWSSS